MHGDGVPLALDVLDVLGRAEVLELLGPDHVFPRDDLPAVPDRDDQRLVDEVLDRGAGGVRGDRGELVDLLGGELVGNLRQVALVGAHAPGLARVAHAVDPVDAAGAQERFVQCLRHVRGHHDQDPVLGRGLGPHAQRAPTPAVEQAARLLQTRELGEQRLERALAATAAHHAVHATRHEAVARRRGIGGRGAHGLAGEHPAGVVGEVGHAVAARALERRGVAGAAAAGAALCERATTAQRVGLVEEHDHAAVAEREPAQLPEERLDLEDADAHEHVVERAGVDEDVWPAGLARHGLGHERLAGAGRSPEQHAGGDVAALLLDGVRVLQEDDVLLDPVDHVVLAPDVAEEGGDVVGEVGVDAATREQPEQADELERDEEEREQQLHDERQRLVEQVRAPGRSPGSARSAGSDPPRQRPAPGTARS